MENIKKHLMCRVRPNSPDGSGTADGAATRGTGAAPYTPGSFEGQLDSIQHYCGLYYNTLSSLCQYGLHLAEMFTAVFNDTPFLELSTNFRDILKELSTATEQVTAEVKTDIISMVMELMKRETSEKNAESIQVLGKCFLTVMQTQVQFATSAMESMSSLSVYRDTEDVLGDSGNDWVIKVASSSWLNARQAYNILRQPEVLSDSEVSLVERSLSADGGQPSQLQAEAQEKYCRLLQRYSYQLENMLEQEYRVLAGFPLNPKDVRDLLEQGGAGSDDDDGDPSASSQLLQLAHKKHFGCRPEDLCTDKVRELIGQEVAAIGLKVGELTIGQGGEAKEKMETVEKLVNNLMEQESLSLDVDMVLLEILGEVCPLVSYAACQTAIQIMYGRKDLIRFQSELVEGKFTHYAEMSVIDGAIQIKVPTVWSIAERYSTPNSEEGGQLAMLQATYTSKIDLEKILNKRKQGLPTVEVVLICPDPPRSSPVSADPPAPPLEEGVGRNFPHSIASNLVSMARPITSIPNLPAAGLKKTITRLTSVFGGWRVGPKEEAPPAAPSASPPHNQGPAERGEATPSGPRGELARPAVTLTTDTTPEEEKSFETVFTTQAVFTTAAATETVSTAAAAAAATETSGARKPVPGLISLPASSPALFRATPALPPPRTAPALPPPRTTPALPPPRTTPSDEEVQGVIDFLSGGGKREAGRPPAATPHLPGFTKAGSSASLATTTGGSSSSASLTSASTGSYDNFNPHYSDMEGVRADQRLWSSVLQQVQRLPPSHQHPLGPLFPGRGTGPRGTTADPSDLDFVRYVANNIPGRRSSQGHLAGSRPPLPPVPPVSRWYGPPAGDKLNSSWPTVDPGHAQQPSNPASRGGGDPGGPGPGLSSFSNTWPSSRLATATGATPAADSAGSSSDECSSSTSENVFSARDSVFSMGLGLTGPQLMASVNKRRNSSGGEEDRETAAYVHMQHLEISETPKSTKTWPPKSVWQ